MLITFVRHAQSVANLLNRPDSDPNNNSSLTDTGREQALHTALQLKDMPFDALFVSRFNRTQQTAKIINQFHHLPLIVDERIDETRSGLHGISREEQVELLKKIGVRSWKTRPWSLRFFEGETVEEELLRVTDFINEIKNKNFKHILIISHGEPIQLFLGLLRNTKKEEMLLTEYLPNAAYVTVEVNT